MGMNPPWITQYDDDYPKTEGGRSSRSYKKILFPSSSRERSGRKVRTCCGNETPPQTDSDEEDKAIKNRRKTQFANFSK